ncbi:hypothetical protein [Streptomyces sp. MBT49]|uniref:hypothetical protein n=1 Tax=Streptomyces sp. MBT49 TaxID=1488380 RepID=UPI0027DC659F|nr:hypothetical protein [Streptomyces sp. MBT49]
MPDVNPNANPEATAHPAPGAPADPENRRSADDRADAVRRDAAAPAGETARSTEPGRSTEPARSTVPGRSGVTGLRATNETTDTTGATGVTGTTARSADTVPSDRAGSPDGAVLPVEKARPSAGSRGTAPVTEPTPLGAGTGADTGVSAGTGTLHASDEDGTAARHHERGAVDTVSGREPAAASAGSAGRDTYGAHGASLLPVDECDRMASRMRHAVVGFVDGPRDAVAEADQVLEELAASFTDAVDRRRRALRGTWQSAEATRDGKDAKDGKDRVAAPVSDIDTEQLRLTLKDYRELTERLLHL